MAAAAAAAAIVADTAAAVAVAATAAAVAADEAAVAAATEAVDEAFKLKLALRPQGDRLGAVLASGLGVQLDAGAVDAVTHPGRFGAVGKNMA